MKETAIQSKIIKALKRETLGVPVAIVNLHGGPYHPAGLPDVMVIRNGAVTFLEVKRPKQKPTLIQTCMMAKLRKAGAVAEVVHSSAEALHLMKKRP